MSYDKNLADRIKKILQMHPGCTEKKMFGGVGFMVGGNMACGVQGSDLIVRVGTENNKAALSQPFVRPFMARPGRPMIGWVLVAPQSLLTEYDLHTWLEMGYKYASSLPAKS